MAKKDKFLLSKNLRSTTENIMQWRDAVIKQAKKMAKYKDFNGFPFWSPTEIYSFIELVYACDDNCIPCIIPADKDHAYGCNSGALAIEKGDAVYLPNSTKNLLYSWSMIIAVTGWDRYQICCRDWFVEKADWNQVVNCFDVCSTFGHTNPNQVFATLERLGGIKVARMPSHATYPLVIE